MLASRSAADPKQSSLTGLHVNPGRWRKGRQSGPHCDNCVEVALVDGSVLLRDSKNPQGPVLVFTQDEWAAFVGSAKDNEFDL